MEKSLALDASVSRWPSRKAQDGRGRGRRMHTDILKKAYTGLRCDNPASGDVCHATRPSKVNTSYENLVPQDLLRPLAGNNGIG